MSEKDLAEINERLENLEKRVGTFESVLHAFTCDIQAMNTRVNDTTGHVEILQSDKETLATTLAKLAIEHQKAASVVQSLAKAIHDLASLYERDKLEIAKTIEMQTTVAATLDKRLLHIEAAFGPTDLDHVITISADDLPPVERERFLEALEPRDTCAPSLSALDGKPAPFCMNCQHHKDGFCERPGDERRAVMMNEGCVYYAEFKPIPPSDNTCLNCRHGTYVGSKKVNCAFLGIVGKDNKCEKFAGKLPINTASLKGTETDK